MNVAIARLFTFFLVLFLVLVGATTWWTTVGAKGLRDNTNNKRAELNDLKIKRGTITAADGLVLAKSVKTAHGVYTRRYPQHGLFGHAVGYSFADYGRAGLEASRNDELTGAGNEFGSIIDELRGKQRTGDDVQTTLDPKAQRIALQGLRSTESGRGAVVALDPRTGAVKVMASLPAFDPAGGPKQFPALNRDKSSPLFNRATQAGYVPGSTFKVVTAAAAIDSGQFTPSSTLSGKNGIKISGVPLQNDAGEDFGRIDMTTALTHSVNTYWAQVGEKLGKPTMKKYMERFGFDRKPPLDYPKPQKVASGERSARGNLIDPTSPRVDVGRMAIGQDKLAVSPLQMAMVASAVANGGVLIKPHLTEKVTDQDGRTVKDTSQGGTAGRVMKASTANEVRDMMLKVVDEGTGTQAALAGLAGQTAGKTGTAQIIPAQNITQPWFIGFAPANNPKIAIAVTVEHSTGGFGGTVAAPIFKQVAESLLSR